MIQQNSEIMEFKELKSKILKALENFDILEKSRGKKAEIGHITIHPDGSRSQKIADGVWVYLPKEKTTQELKVEIENIKEGDIESLKKLVSPLLPTENGHWSGEKGNSMWIPDLTFVPQKSNPNKLNWKKIFDVNEIKGINFKNGFPDFSVIALETVEIEGFSSNRDSNFSKAYEKLIEKIGDKRVQILEDSKLFTWHEKEDCKTMQLVFRIIHNNISHTGGVAIIKRGKK